MSYNSIITMMRPHQYIKNIFIFLPLFFALKIMDIGLLSKGIIAFIAFSLTASAIYIINDYFDIEEDRKHPRKKYRPLASGAISKNKALIMVGTLLSSGLILMYFISLDASLLLLVYIGINLAYSTYLKHIAILDVMQKT